MLVCLSPFSPFSQSHHVCEALIMVRLNPAPPRPPPFILLKSTCEEGLMRLTRLHPDTRLASLVKMPWARPMTAPWAASHWSIGGGSDRCLLSLVSTPHMLRLHCMTVMWRHTWGPLTAHVVTAKSSCWLSYAPSMPTFIVKWGSGGQSQGCTATHAHGRLPHMLTLQCTVLIFFYVPILQNKKEYQFWNLQVSPIPKMVLNIIFQNRNIFENIV